VTVDPPSPSEQLHVANNYEHIPYRDESPAPDQGDQQLIFRLETITELHNPAPLFYWISVTFGVNLFDVILLVAVTILMSLKPGMPPHTW
jgi:hypothetical protein